MQIHFTKCHGSGNDFVLLQNESISQNWTDEQIGVFSKEVCRRDGLIGADSLILIEESTNYDAKMRVYNADGSIAEMCGNALRCVARKVIEQQPRKESVKIEITTGESLSCWKDQMLANQVVTMQVEIGLASLNVAKWIPTLMQDQQHFLGQNIDIFNTKETFSAMTIPNPHLVSFVETIDQKVLTKWGEAIIKNPKVFPYGINVSMASLIDEKTLFVLTYERGCGITAACGTAISSSCYIGTFNEVFPVGEVITVHTPGGVARCLIPSLEKGRVLFSGNATFEYHAVMNYDEKAQTCSHLQKTQDFQEEQEAFHQFLNTRNESVLKIMQSLKQ